VVEMRSELPPGLLTSRPTFSCSSSSTFQTFQLTRTDPDPPDPTLDATWPHPGLPDLPDPTWPDNKSYSRPTGRKGMSWRTRPVAQVQAAPGENGRTTNGIDARRRVCRSAPWLAHRTAKIAGQKGSRARTRRLRGLR